MAEMNKDALIILKELKKGQEIANQLRINLISPSSLSSTPQTCRELLLLQNQKLLSSLEKALSMLKPHPSSFSSSASAEPPAPPVRSRGGVAANCRPKSEVRDNNNDKDVSKRRKAMSRWSEQVRTCSSSGLEGPADDGYSWRKYGQKDILGAHHPRGYYRCTHRHAQGCLATKQVQKSDQDPSIFEITYKGRHTCTQYSHFTPPKILELEIESPKKQDQEPVQKQETDREEEKPPQHPFPLFAGLTVKTEDLEDNHAKIFPSFSFACTPPEILDDDYNIFFDDAFVTNFISPSTSDSGYFSPNLRMGHNSDSDLTDILSAPNSFANSPIGALDLTIENLNFDPSSLFS